MLKQLSFHTNKHKTSILQHFFSSVSVCGTNRYCIPFTFTLKLNNFFVCAMNSFRKKNGIVLLGPLNGLWEALNGKKFILLKSRKKNVYFVRWFYASLHYFNKCSSERELIRSLFLSLNEICFPRAYFKKKTQREKERKSVFQFFPSLESRNMSFVGKIGRN